MILSRSFFFFFSALTLVAAQSSTTNCNAAVRLSTSQPGHGSFMYHDIIVDNTGSCGITKVIVAITLPPYLEVFNYQNMTETGELFGLPTLLPPTIFHKGGTIVLKSARVPIVVVGSVECEASCNSAAAPATPAVPTPDPIPTPPRSTRGLAPTATVKVEVEYGANPRWIALSLLDEVDTDEMWLVDAKGSLYQMKRENWETKTAFTLTSGQQPLELPLSLKLNSYYGESIVLKDFITSFTYNVLDTKVAFQSTPFMTPTDYTMQLVSHTSSNPNWIGLTPYGTKAVGVTSISIQASNTELIPMNMESTGFFSYSSPSLPLQLPITAVLSFNDGTTMTIQHAVEF